jgi:hypothetical protein
LFTILQTQKKQFDQSQFVIELLLSSIILKKYSRHKIKAQPQDVLRSSTNKADRHDITEIVLKVALNTTTLTLTQAWSETAHSNISYRKIE